MFQFLQILPIGLLPLLKPLTLKKENMRLRSLMDEKINTHKIYQRELF